MLDNKVEVDRDVLVATADALLKLQDDNPSYRICVSMLGGEPLMVVDDSLEFIERVTPHGIGLELFSNLNFDPDSNNIRKVLDYQKTNDRFKVVVSWHKISNRDYVKTNILLMKDFIVVDLLLCDDDDLIQVYNDYLWLKSVGVSFRVSYIRKGENNIFTLFDAPEYHQMISDSIYDDEEEFNVMGDRKMGVVESREMDLLNISKQYYTICRISALSIDKFGEITTSCGYPYEGGNIKDRGLEVKDAFCSGYPCRCMTDNYKKLLREKK